MNVARFLLSFPILVRAIIDLIRFIMGNFDTFLISSKGILTDEEVGYSFTTYLLGQFIPLVVQLSSLQFGYIRS
jgi:hypothetical protein